MPRPGFYNDNEYRAYPFIFQPAQTDTLPYSLVVDAGIIMGLDSEFDPESHTVWLHAVRRTTEAFEIELRSDAPGAAEPLVFTRALDADEWQSEHKDSAPYLKDSNSCATEPAWSGFLVTGPLQELDEILPENGAISVAPELFVLEPGRIQSLVRHYLRSLSVGNLSRVMAGSPCAADSEPIPRHVIVNARCVSGDVKLKEGYNCRITQSDTDNEIRILAGRGLGTPVDANLCIAKGEIPFYANEQPPPGSLFLSGGPACDELVASINGVVGPDVNIVGGTGVSIAVDQNTNSINIKLSTNNLAGNCGPS